MPKNFWLKDLWQRRHTRHLSLVNPCHFMSSCNINLTCGSEVKHLYIRSLNFQTIKILVFPAFPTLQQGGGKMETEPFQLDLENRTIPNWPPNRWMPISRLEPTVYRHQTRYPNLNRRYFPRYGRKRYAAGCSLTLCECKQVDWWKESVIRSSEVFGSNDRW